MPREFNWGGGAYGDGSEPPEKVKQLVIDCRECQQRIFQMKKDSEECETTIDESVKRISAINVAIAGLNGIKPKTAECLRNTVIRLLEKISYSESRVCELEELISGEADTLEYIDEALSELRTNAALEAYEKRKAKLPQGRVIDG